MQLKATLPLLQLGVQDRDSDTGCRCCCGHSDFAYSNIRVYLLAHATCWPLPA